MSINLNGAVKKAEPIEFYLVTVSDRRV